MKAIVLAGIAGVGLGIFSTYAVLAPAGSEGDGLVKPSAGKTQRGRSSVLIPRDVSGLSLEELEKRFHGAKSVVEQSALIVGLSQLSSEQLESHYRAFLEKSRSGLATFQSESFAMEILGVWTEMNPDRALALVEEVAEDRPTEARELRGRVLTILAQSDPQRAYNIFNSLPAAEAGGDVVRMFGYRLAEGAPELAKKLYLDRPELTMNDKANLLRGFSESDPDFVIDEIAKLANTADHAWFVRFAVTDALRSRPDRAREFLDSDAAMEMKKVALQVLAGQGFEDDPDGTLALIATQHGETRLAGYEAVLSRLMDLDPKKAVTTVFSAENLKDLSRLGGQLVTDGGPSGRQAIVDFFTNEKNPNRRKELGDGLAQSLYQVSLPALKDLTERFGNEAPGGLRVGLAEKLVAVDPQKALAEVLEIDQSDHSMKWQVTRFMATLAKQDTESVARHFNEMTASENKSDQLENIVGELARNDWESGAALLASLERPEVERDAFERYGSQLAGQDVDAALEWSETVPEAVKLDVLGRVLPELAKNEPDSALERAQQLLDSVPDEDFEDALKISQSIGRGWAESEPESAAQWAAALPESARPKQHLRSVLGTWARRDSKGMKDWVLSMQNSELRDVGIGSTYSQVAENNPAQGTAYLLQMSPGEARSGKLAHHYRNWIRRDEETARKDLARQTFSAEERAAIKEILED